MRSVWPLTGERERERQHRKPANRFLHLHYLLLLIQLYTYSVTVIHFSHEHKYILIPFSESLNMWVVLRDPPPAVSIAISSALSLMEQVSLVSWEGIPWVRGPEWPEFLRTGLSAKIFGAKALNPAVSEPTESNGFLSVWRGEPRKGFEQRNDESKERLGFCKSIYWKNVGQVASLLNILNVSQNYFLKDLGHEFRPSVPALIKGYQLWIKMADWTNDFLLLPLQILLKWQKKKYKNKSISGLGSPLGVLDD